MNTNINKQQVLADTDAALSGLTNELQSISDKQINKVPFEGSWTAAQVAQHMIICNTGFADMMHAPVIDTERPIDELIPRLKADFLNFEVKFETAPFLAPEKKDYDKDELIATLDKIRSSILDAIETTDLSKTITAFELPVYGKLTRLEAANFVMVHTQRHTHQLKNIHNSLIK